MAGKKPGLECPTSSAASDAGTLCPRRSESPGVSGTAAAENSTPGNLEIVVSRTDRTLTVTETAGSRRSVLLTAATVTGCDDSETPPGAYRAGQWIKDKTNPVHGPTPWSKDPLGNPYGPYFLPLLDKNSGRYTTYGIHGTRGPIVGNFEKPPLPEALMGLIVGDKDQAKYLYCSHGCVRVSNQNIVKLHDLTTASGRVGRPISITIK